MCLQFSVGPLIFETTSLGPVFSLKILKPDHTDFNWDGVLKNLAKI
jgi:hypothetical protein